MVVSSSQGCLACHHAWISPRYGDEEVLKSLQPGIEDKKLKKFGS